MLQPLILAIGLLATAGCAWFYIQMQKSTLRTEVKEAEMGDKANLMAELADEISVASQYLYDAMDDCGSKIDQFERTWAERSALLERVLALPAPVLVDPSAVSADTVSVGNPLTDDALDAHLSAVAPAEKLAGASLQTGPGMTASKLSAYKGGGFVETEQNPGRTNPKQEKPADLSEDDLLALAGLGVPQQIFARQAVDKQTVDKKTVADAEASFKERLAESMASQAEEEMTDEGKAVYHPHFHALELASSGVDMLEIAKETGLGVEELRLLLRFREALSV